MCKVGDQMQVKVIAIDDQDRVKLSRKALLREGKGPGGGPDSGPPPREQQRDGGRRDDRGGGNRGRRD